nr:hypothetical protein CFP56_64693 [Quercus suber]
MGAWFSHDVRGTAKETADKLANASVEMQSTSVKFRETIERFNSALDQDGGHTLLEGMSHGAATGAISAAAEQLTPTLQVVQTWARFIGVATSVVALTTTLMGADAVSHFKKLAVEMSKSLRSLCDAAEVSTNLHHEDKFPQWVLDFVSDQITKTVGHDDLDAINSQSLFDHFHHPAAVEPDTDSQQQQAKPAHYFFVYHPGNDWHAPFNSLLRNNPLPGFVGATNNLDALGLFLLDFRKLVGPTAIMHVLLPSAHMYVIPDKITVAQEHLPLRVTGQTHRSGNPYVHASIVGLSDDCITDVGLLPIPNEVTTSTMVGAVSGGIGAGVAGTVVGGVGIAFVVAFGCTLAGPALVTAAALDIAVTGSMIVGGLASGTTAGALTGIHVRESAKWKGTRRDPRVKAQR